MFLSFLRRKRTVLSLVTNTNAYHAILKAILLYFIILTSNFIFSSTLKLYQLHFMKMEPLCHCENFTFQPLNQQIFTLIYLASSYYCMVIIQHCEYNSKHLYNCDLVFGSDVTSHNYKFESPKLSRRVQVKLQVMTTNFEKPD